MVYLWVVSLAWAFSFGLIKGVLTGLSPHFLSFARLAISFLVFLPLLRTRGLNRKNALHLILVGALQYGVMYISYNYAFRYLKAYEVALFTIFTPIYVTLINDGMQRSFHRIFLLTAALAVIGTGIVQVSGLLKGSLLQGFGWVQLSNLCFAFGQVFYREVMRRSPELKDQHVFALPYLGATLITALSSLLFGGFSGLALTQTQALTLLYLGAVASGVCFFLWNLGARKVDIGALAIFNNLKVPLAVAVSLIFFGEQANLLNLAIGGVIVFAALAINEFTLRKTLVREEAAEG
ncbi:MAG: EamA family transporter [Anaerolineaceae bacterium]|nr:EamA family transporter [Anaerolineaceae bacterium]